MQVTKSPCFSQKWCTHLLPLNECIIHSLFAPSGFVQAKADAPQVGDIREVGENAEGCELSCPTTISLVVQFVTGHLSLWGPL